MPLFGVTQVAIGLFYPQPGQIGIRGQYQTSQLIPQQPWQPQYQQPPLFQNLQPQYGPSLQVQPRQGEYQAYQGLLYQAQPSYGQMQGRPAFNPYTGYVPPPYQGYPPYAGMKRPMA